MLSHSPYSNKISSTHRMYDLAQNKNVYLSKDEKTSYETFSGLSLQFFRRLFSNPSSLITAFKFKYKKPSSDIVSCHQSN